MELNLWAPLGAGLERPTARRQKRRTGQGTSMKMLSRMGSAFACRHPTSSFPSIQALHNPYRTRCQLQGKEREKLSL